MQTIGIICEYNPFHLGHRKQIAATREEFGGDCGIVCLMSGNFVQRGAPAIVDKSLRAEAAVRCGADLVLELPVEYALSSAEGFAAGGVGILAGFCDGLRFGCETADRETLLSTAGALLRPEFSPALRAQLDRGLSFPAARQEALRAMGGAAEVLSRPNDILAVEYCKAILAGGFDMSPLPMARPGDYHAAVPDGENPSATAVRGCMVQGGEWKNFIPREAWEPLSRGTVHTLRAGERAVLSRLRAMTEAEFAALPYGSEGLWRKLMHAVREKGALEEILTAAKSRRYTRTRLDRMVLCAFLGLTAADLAAPAPYVRVLAFTARGQKILKAARKTGTFLNAGEAPDSPYWEKERRWGDLYGLFSIDNPEAPGTEARRRIYRLPDQPE